MPAAATSPAHNPPVKITADTAFIGCTGIGRPQKRTRGDEEDAETRENADRRQASYRHRADHMRDEGPEITAGAAEFP